MDRISTLRNVEEALAEFETGDSDLETTEERVLAVIRTYATSFESDGCAAYLVEPVDRRDSFTVVASSPDAATRRVAELLDDDVVPERIERLSD